MINKIEIAKKTLRINIKPITINIENLALRKKNEERKSIKDLKVKVTLDLDLEIKKRRRSRQRNRKNQLKLKIRER